jgi:hypothetical protein
MPEGTGITRQLPACPQGPGITRRDNHRLRRVIGRTPQGCGRAGHHSIKGKFGNLRSRRVMLKALAKMADERYRLAKEVCRVLV